MFQIGSPFNKMIFFLGPCPLSFLITIHSCFVTVYQCVCVCIRPIKTLSMVHTFIYLNRPEDITISIVHSCIQIDDNLFVSHIMNIDSGWFIFIFIFLFLGCYNCEKNEKEKLALVVTLLRYSDIVQLLAGIFFWFLV